MCGSMYVYEVSVFQHVCVVVCVFLTLFMGGGRGSEMDEKRR